MHEIHKMNLHEKKTVKYEQSRSFLCVCNAAYVGLQLAFAQIPDAGWKPTEGNVLTVPCAESLKEECSSRSPVGGCRRSLEMMQDTRNTFLYFINKG